VATAQQDRMPLPLVERPGDSRASVHTVIVSAGLAAAVVMMRAIHFFAPEWVAVMLLDIHRSTYPITIQTFEWLAFGFCLGELTVRVLAERAVCRTSPHFELSAAQARPPRIKRSGSVDPAFDA
jgi:hypothetical protein